VAPEPRLGPSKTLSVAEELDSKVMASVRGGNGVRVGAGRARKNLGSGGRGKPKGPAVAIGPRIGIYDRAAYEALTVAALAAFSMRL
jgi:hypothetical protein